MTIFQRFKYWPIIISIVFVFILTGCLSRSASQYVKHEIGLNVSNCILIDDTDSHGGFHGDGERTIVFNCSNTTMLDQVGSWNNLPLSNNLDIMMYGGIKDEEEYGYNLAINNNIPKITNGYYYFIDRYTRYYKDDKDIYSDNKLLDRYSHNFTLAMYDLDTNYLYYYEYDS